MRHCDHVSRHFQKSKSVLQLADEKLQDRLKNVKKSLQEKMLNFKAEYVQQVVGNFKKSKQGFVYGKVVQGRFISGEVNPYLKFN